MKSRKTPRVNARTNHVSYALSGIRVTIERSYRKLNVGKNLEIIITDER